MVYNQEDQPSLFLDDELGTEITPQFDFQQLAEFTVLVAVFPNENLTVSFLHSVIRRKK